ncbi:MAG: hypothetical protein OXG60_06745 [Chloroflexi bacterium]|nr:hypothetical protein [Chloroflexota bacterium]
MTVLTPSGYRYVYIRGAKGMELAAVINDPNYVANPSWREDVESSTAFWSQTLAEKGNQPEWVMEQEDQAFRADIVEFARILGVQSDLAALSETELLQEIFKKDELIALGETQASVFGGSKEYITGLKRALYTRETAERIGIDPGILAMVHLWEDKAMHSNPATSMMEHGSYTWVYNINIFPPGHKLNFVPFLREREKSFGLAQIQIPVAIEMLNKHKDSFEDLNLPIDDMQDVWGGHELTDGWSNYDVGYQLQHNDEFNIRVAGVYLKHLQYEIQELLQAYGVMVSDEEIDQPHVSSQDLLMLAVGAYNQGTDTLYTGFPERFKKDGAAGVIEGVEATVDITYVHNVLSMKDEALEKYGLLYTG